jgi:addiction module HigA family antidote
MATKTLKPVHPGEVLREEFIKPLGMSQRSFAATIGVTHTRLNQIVNEKRSVTADTALRLARALGTTPEFWMNLQSKFDLDLGRDEAGDVIKQDVQPMKK